MNSNDRALLEMAAKSAGIKIDKSPYSGRGRNNTGFDLSGNAVIDWHNGTTWNPLVDDGDALRLAVKLCIQVRPFSTCVSAYYFDANSVKRMIEVSYGDDELAATRRAIVCAAAQFEKLFSPAGAD